MATDRAQAMATNRAQALHAASSCNCTLWYSRSSHPRTVPHKRQALFRYLVLFFMVLGGHMQHRVSCGERVYVHEGGDDERG